MKALTAALLVSFALLCAPSALAMTGLAPIDVGSVPLPEAPQLPPVDVPEVKVPQADVPVAVGIDASVDGAQVQVGAGAGASAADGSLSMGTSSASVAFVDQAAAVAQGAAGAGALTVLMVASSSGLDGLRALFARPGARLQQAGRFALRLLPFAPLAGLFSRIQGQKVLDNPVRAHVHQVVVQDPGLSLEEVRSRAGIAWGTAVHHLRRLEDTGLLVSIVQNARRRYFAANTPASSHRAHVAALSHPTARRVADFVRQRPGVDQSGLCAALGLRNPTASKHLQQLATHGLVLAERDGRRCRYHPTTALHATLGILETPTPPAVMQVPRTPGVPA